jgi:hypothetical protein
MNIKQILGVCICAVGIYLIIASIHGMHTADEAQGFVNNVSNFFEHNPSTWNPLIKFFGGQAQEKIEHGTNQAVMALIAGICLTVLGSTMAVVYRGRKKEK